MLDAVANCEDCEWNTYAKNAEGNAAQHAERTGHTVNGEKYYGFKVTADE